MKKLKAGNEVHVGAVLRNGETFARSGSKKRKTFLSLTERAVSIP